jgi:1-phosphofructokinase family hexose kinase
MIYTLTLNPALDLEFTVEHIEMGSVHRALASRADVGGKGFNVSRVLSLIGENTTAIGFTGGGTGKRLEEGLNNLHIPCELVQVRGETRTNVSIISGSPSEYIKINHPGPQVAGEEVEKILARMGEMTCPSDIWVLSGSLPPGVNRDFYARAITLIHAAKGLVILDTSGPALKYGCAAGPELVKPNAEEAAELVGMLVDGPETAIEASKALIALGPAQVVLSLGAQGGVALDGKNAWIARSPNIQATNPVGAGDALVAGLSAGMRRGWTLDQSLRLGIACGASAAQQPGTGIGSLDEIMRLSTQVEIRQV